MSISISENDLIDGLKRQDAGVLDYIYREVGPKVKAIIMRAGGSDDEAEDIFQEGVISAFLNVRTGKYQQSGQTKFSTYLTQVCKYKWYDTLKSARKSKSGGELNDNLIVLDDDDIQKTMELDEKYSTLHRLIDKLGDQCKEILQRFYWLKESVATISAALNMEPASVKNGKYRCMNKLKEMAQNNANLRG